MNKERTIEQILLDYSLGQLDPDEAVVVEQRIANEPEVKRTYEKVRSILDPLDTWTAAEPPENLVGSILDKIESSRFPRLAGSSDGFKGMTPPVESSLPPRSTVSLREVLAVAACVALFFGVMFPSVARNRSVAQRNECKSNLASLGFGLSQYFEDHFQAWPNAGTQPGDNWLEESPSRKNLVVLVRLQYLPDGRILICPGATANPEDTTDIRGMCTYDMQNMAGPVPNPVSPGLTPLVSDANPLFIGGKFNPDVDPFSANSHSHGQKGQNMLFGDGHASWTTSPETADGDNIWTAGNIREYKGTEVPSSASDAFLVP